MPEVACVGVACVDVLAKTVHRTPERGKLDIVETLQLQVGGCAANAAIALSRLGITSALIGKIGNDGFGRYLLKVLQEEGVNTEGLVIDPRVQTSASVVLIDCSGERSILHCLGTNALFTSSVRYSV
ncbi:MAG: carbohydrate kinase family protein [Candidatus Caldatribacteriaceae bacterium]